MGRLVADGGRIFMTGPAAHLRPPSLERNAPPGLRRRQRLGAEDSARRLRRRRVKFLVWFFHGDRNLLI